MWACGRGKTHRQTHRRAWPQYISRRLRLTRNVASGVWSLGARSSRKLSVRVETDNWGALQRRRVPSLRGEFTPVLGARHAVRRQIKGGLHYAAGATRVPTDARSRNCIETPRSARPALYCEIFVNYREAAGVRSPDCRVHSVETSLLFSCRRELTHLTTFYFALRK